MLSRFAGMTALAKAVRPHVRLQTLTTAVYKDPNFPMADGRVHHLDVKAGEVANRVLSVGDAARGERVAQHFDHKKYFKHVSHRGFVVYTGFVKGVPVSIVVTGMGLPMMDFVVRETRAIVDGPMAMLRYGTCGGFGIVRPGDVIIAKDSVLIRREPDYWRDKSVTRVDGEADPTYSHSITTPVSSDPTLTAIYNKHLAPAVSSVGFNVHLGKNACADFFYDSQGRVGTAFTDDNATLTQRLRTVYPDVLSCEMETFHMLHLARCSKGSIVASGAAIAVANRGGSAVVAKEDLMKLEYVGGRAALHALADYKLDLTNVPVPTDAVWLKL